MESLGKGDSDDICSEAQHKTDKVESTTIKKGPNKSKTKSKFDDPTMDPDWLHRKLREELNKDSQYYLENDAKIRAVTQGTVDYEQFRQMVLGAHLRPLQKTDKVEGCQNGKRPYVIWNTATKKDDESNDAQPNK